MRRLGSLISLALSASLVVAFTYWYGGLQVGTPPSQPTAVATAGVEQTTTPGSGRKILYYRNPMGAPDTSPVPKKDPMGMDYIPVYVDEQEDPGTVRVSLDKVQRIGVRTEKAKSRSIVREVRAVGRVEHDEALLTIVALRTDGFIEDLFVNKTGQHVKEGEPLFRLYSSQIQLAQSDLIVAVRAQGRMTGPDADKNLEGAMLRLRNLGVPQSRIDEVRKTGTNPRTIDWPSPATGDIIEKKIINGQRVMAGDELYRIADHSHVWVIADVAEADIGSIKVGTPVTVTLRADHTPAGARRSDLHLSGAQAGDAHRACAHRASQPGTALKDLDVCRCGLSGRRRGGSRSPRSPTTPSSTAARNRWCWSQRATAVSSPRGQARSSRRRLRRDYRRSKAGRGRRDLGELPDRRGEQSESRAANLQPAGERSHDRGTYSLVGAQRLSGRACDDLRHARRHLRGIAACRSTPSPISRTFR